MKKAIILLIILFSLPFNFCIAADEPATIHHSGDWKFSIPFGKSYNYSDILVERAVDGDTLKLESGERVRLIGIDTPEMHESNKLYKDSQRSGEDVATIQKLGRRAYEFTKKLVEGKRVSLEFDVEKYDKYDRLLAYVYLKDGGTFVNAEIVKQGYASLMTIPPNAKYANLFLKLYQEARNNKRGLWK
ncbi:MAG: thermonuclease family protein [Candidatus Omnitrophota bacterium]|nr:thermonuclease family protein [Candidatus Omnitrophota bacterium]